MPIRALLPGTFVVLASTGILSCGSPIAPSSDAIATFRVVDETFRVRLTMGEQVRAAQAAQTGTGPRIPNGRIVSGTDVNAGWSWHLEDLEFADVTIEVCDGRPSDVERTGVTYGGGRFCPWAAEVVSIEER